MARSVGEKLEVARKQFEERKGQEDKVIDGEGGEDTSISEREDNSSIAEVDANKSNHDEEMSKKTTNTMSV